MGTVDSRNKVVADFEVLSMRDEGRDVGADKLASEFIAARDKITKIKNTVLMGINGTRE